MTDSSRKYFLYSAEKKFIEALVKQHKLFFIGALLFLLIAGIGMKSITMENQARKFFHADNPLLIALEELEYQYNKIEAISLVVAFNDGTVF